MLEKMFRLVRAVLVASSLSFAVSRASAEDVSVRSFDSFTLRTRVEVPAGTEAQSVRRVAVLIHGSGPQSLDEDLTTISVSGTTNCFFADLAAALLADGFAVVRYDKRSFVAKQKIGEDGSFAQTSSFKRYAADPLRYFVEDAQHLTRWTARRFPGARVFLVGHSEGAYVALQVANADQSIAGVGLISLAAASLDQVLLEQYVHRSRPLFEKLDKDHDGALSSVELASPEPEARALSAQMGVLDLDHDGRLSRDEFMAGNFSNIALDGPTMREYRIRESRYPRPAEIVRQARFPVLFFHGEWDNQAPVYGIKAIELLNNVAWKKTGLSFRYFPGLGHALDPRSSAQDFLYRRASPTALQTLAAALAGL